MSKLRGTTQTKINQLKSEFNEVFKTTGKKSGNEFEKGFIKGIVGGDNGFNRIVDMYKGFVEKNKEVFGETENINDIFKYGKTSRRAKFIKTLGDLSRDPDSNVKKNVFLLEGLNYDDRDALKVLGVISSPTPSEIEKVKEAVGIEPADSPKGKRITAASTASVEEEEKEGEKSGSKKMSSEQFKQFEKERQAARDAAQKMGAGGGAGAGAEEEMTMEPPTFSPDEMQTAAEDIAEERKAQAEAREARPTTGMTAEQEAALLDIPQDETKGVEMKVTKQDRKSEIDDLQPLPSKSDFIPPMRLGTRGKDVKELLDDISFFMKNFKSQLKKEGEFFKQIDKTNISQVRELHDRIVGKLAPKQKTEKDKRVGIIVNADDYIREQMKRILQEQTFSSLRPQDVVIDVGSKRAEGRESDNKDFGDFEVKRTIDGGLASKREAVYRYMPSEKDDEVNEVGKSEIQRKKPRRLELPKTKLNNQRTTAIRMNLNNPFRVPQKTMKLRYLY